tara:strand:- start:3099 stop:3665 length:567 start_codon:yes stop_codon:yes gene_type:complete
VVQPIIAGIDEAGRGPLAGRVWAAAVIIDKVIDGVADSKKVSPKKRQQLAELIKKHAIAYAYGQASVVEIDTMNIHHATLQAMQRALDNLTVTPTYIKVDGLYVPKTNIVCEAFIKGDEHIYQISAASILAKVARDAEMLVLHEAYPHYGFLQHKGYGTKQHIAAVQKFGPCIHHRQTFLRKILAKSG